MATTYTTAAAQWSLDEGDYVLELDDEKFVGISKIVKTLTEWNWEILSLIPERQRTIPSGRMAVPDTAPRTEFAVTTQTYVTVYRIFMRREED